MVDPLKKITTDTLIYILHDSNPFPSIYNEQVKLLCFITNWQAESNDTHSHHLLLLKWSQIKHSLFSSENKRDPTLSPWQRKNLSRHVNSCLSAFKMAESIQNHFVRNEKSTYENCTIFMEENIPSCTIISGDGYKIMVNKVSNISWSCRASTSIKNVKMPIFKASVLTPFRLYLFVIFWASRKSFKNDLII